MEVNSEHLQINDLKRAAAASPVIKKIQQAKSELARLIDAHQADEVIVSELHKISLLLGSAEFEALMQLQALRR